MAAAANVGQNVWQMHPEADDTTKNFKRNYDLKEELGKGGFGTVRRCIYKAPDPAGPPRKELAAKINNTPERKQEMIHEATCCKELSRIDPNNPSPNPSRFVVNIFDSIHEGDIVYNMYEMASGGDLSDEIVRKEFFRPQEAADAIRQILQGVNHIHERGWIHLDIKPANVLIQSKSVRIYKLADFGLSKRRIQVGGQYVRRAFGNAGTVAYRPPEPILAPPNNVYDTDFDIWSCGVLLYELLAGYQPFWEDDPADTLQKIRDVDYDFPSPEWDGLQDAKEMINMMIAPLNVAAQGRGPRENFAQLSQRAFYIMGANQPLPVDQPDDVLQQYQARRNLKAGILQQHYAAQVAQQVQGAAQQQPGP